ncbi:MAG TPA: SpoIIE family protein phosphatase [Pseudomonadota bacterium]|nr:SpoIIE family protein phosphatase [Pseudomonadota bacterium]
MALNLHSLRVRLVGGVLLGSLALLGLALAGGYAALHGIVLRQANRAALETTTRVATGLASVFEQARVTGAELGYAIQTGVLGRAQVPDLLEARVMRDPAINGALIALEPGALGGTDPYAVHVSLQGKATRERNLATPEYDYRAQDWYQRSLRTEAAWLSAPYLNDTSGGVWVVTYNVPLRRFDKSPLGMVSIDLPLDHLRGIAAALGLPGGDQHQRGSIIDAEGRFVQGPEPEFELKLTVDELIRTRGRADLKPWYDGIASGKPGWFEHTAPDGTRRTTTYAPIGATGWSVASSIDHAELLAPLRAAFLKLVAIGLAGFALLALLVWIVAQRIVRPLEALTDSAAHFARGEFDWPLPRHDARDEVGVLVQALGHARDSLKQYVANLADATAARQKIESELAIAREIQMAMLPHQRELAAGGARLEAAALLEPARQVGGDFYNYFLLDGHTAGFYIGDVSDKGVPAALFMARTTALLENALRREGAPAAALRSAGRELAAENEASMFATALLGTIDLDRGTLALASAGHDAPVLRRACGGVAELPLDSGPALGFEADGVYPEWHGALRPGDTLLAWTDGVTEAFDARGGAFGTDGIARALADDDAPTAQALTDHLRAAVHRHTGAEGPGDDLSILCLRFQPTGGVAPVLRFQSPNDIERLAQLVRELETALAAAGHDAELVHDARLIAEELLTNTLRHGCDPAVAHAIEVEARWTDERLVLAFRDDGAAFDPLARADPDLDAGIDERPIGGLGIFLVRELAESVSYERIGRDNVLRVHLRASARHGNQESA